MRTIPPALFLAASAPANFIDGMVDVGHQVEAVLNDVGLRQPKLDRCLIRTRSDATAMMLSYCISVSFSKANQAPFSYPRPSAGVRQSRPTLLRAECDTPTRSAAAIKLVIDLRPDLFEARSRNDISIGPEIRSWN